MEDEIDDRRTLPVGQLGGVAADGRADDREDARTDDNADAQGRERQRTKRLLERVFRAFALYDQSVDGLGGKDLSGQRCSPRQAYADGIRRLYARAQGRDGSSCQSVVSGLQAYDDLQYGLFRQTLHGHSPKAPIH